MKGLRGALLIILTALSVVDVRETPASALDCSTGLDGGLGSGVISVQGSHVCGPTFSDHPLGAAVRSDTRWVDCGPRGAGETTTASGGPCLQVAAACAGRRPENGKTTMVAQVVRHADGSQQLLSITCDAPIADRRAITATAVREQVQRLVPRPRVGIAPPGGATLVNLQTVLWVDTAADRDLGTVTLLGRRVDLRVHVRTVEWTFGDGERSTTANPGRQYDPTDPCHRALCPTYGGHVYRSAGTMTITAQVTWSGEFRVGAGAWQPISGGVTGPPQTAIVTVRQARGVLVPNDTGR